MPSEPTESEKLSARFGKWVLGGIGGLVLIVLGAWALHFLGPSPDHDENGATRAGEHRIITVTSPDKTYLNKTPRQLLESVESLTDLQANLFIEQTYRGKRIQIQGPVAGVSGIREKAWLVFEIQGVTTRVDMREDQFEKVTHLGEGDAVTVDARFSKMDRIGPDFDDGILLAPPAE